MPPVGSQYCARSRFGGDDYIIKPFGSWALCQNQNSTEQPKASQQKDPAYFCIMTFRLVKSREVTKMIMKLSLHLLNIDFNIFYQHPHQVLTRGHILESYGTLMENLLMTIPYQFI